MLLDWPAFWASIVIARFFWDLSTLDWNRSLRRSCSFVVPLLSYSTPACGLAKSIRAK